LIDSCLASAYSDGKSAKEAVQKALSNLEYVFTSIGEKYQESLDSGNYERFETKPMDMAAIKKMTQGDPDAQPEASGQTMQES